MPETLFISDLHLDADRPSITKAFFALLRSLSATTDAIYILGDLFELWIGDDDDEPFAAECIAALRAASRVTQVFVMHGNRDFLLAAEFAQRTGARVITDPTLITLYDRPILLTHGDALCTGDQAYQALRTVVRSSEWQREQLAKPVSERRSFGASLRAQSRATNANKAETIMDVDDAALRATLRSYDVANIIHGHTHRPGIHALDVGEGRSATRYVLGDWSRYGWLLRLTPNSTQLERFVI